MVHAIEDITVNQGIDPREAVLVGGGGAAGLNCVRIARRLGCAKVVIPGVGAALSAVGALMSDLSADFSRTAFTTSHRFDFERVNATLAALEAECRRFMSGRGTGALEQAIEFSVEGRYPHQVWEIEVPLSRPRFEDRSDVERLVADLHDLHEEMFAIADRRSHIEAVTWRARATCRLPRGASGRLVEAPVFGTGSRQRPRLFRRRVEVGHHGPSPGGDAGRGGAGRTRHHRVRIHDGGGGARGARPAYGRGQHRHRRAKRRGEFLRMPGRRDPPGRSRPAATGPRRVPGEALPARRHS